MKRSFCFAIAGVLTGFFAALALAQDAGTPAFLRSSATLTPRQFTSIQSGAPLVLGLDSKDKSEVAILGAVHLDVPPDFFIRQYRRIEDFKRSSDVLQVGKFGEAPDAADLKTAVFDPGELRSLAKCRAGDCPVKISAQMLESFRHATAASEDNADSMRRILADYVKDYLKRGDDALVVYNDKKPAVSLSLQFQQLLAGFTALPSYAPEFVDYLKRFPTAELAGVENFVYWSREKAGFKTITSLTHVTIYRKEIEQRASYFITSKQIYANHYFNGSVGLTVISAGSTNKDSWMVYINRSRTDVLGGWLSSLKKSVIVSRAEGTMKTQMGAIKKKMEASYQEAGSRK